jgi:hypothetical protein
VRAAGVTLTAATVLGATTWGSDENAGSDLIASDVARWVMTAACAPLLLWGPLLAFATYAHHRRRQTTETR